MAARFFKRKIPDHTANPNALYPDLYDNGNTNFDIQVGTVSNIKAFKFVLADMQLPDAPEFGDAKLVGAKASWYVNSIAVGELNASPALKVWKTKQKIENREGGATDATMVADEDVAVFSSYVGDDNATIMEDFEGKTETDDFDRSTTVIGRSVVVRTDPFIPKTVGYDEGDFYGGKSGWPQQVSRKTHFKRYGTTLPDGTEVYKIKKRLTDDSYGYKSAKSFSLNWGRSDEEVYMKSGIINDIKYTRELSTDEKESIIASNNHVVANRINENNTIFEMVRREKPISTFFADSGEIKDIAFCDAYFSTESVYSSGNSMKMHAMFPRTQLSLTNVFYPKKNNGEEDGLSAYSEQRQTAFVTKQIPTPVRSANNWQGHAENANFANSEFDVSPTIEIDINFEKLAPLLERNNSDNGSYKKRANRSFAITIGKLRPDQNDDLFSYIKRHNNNTANHTTIASATPCMGVIFANDEGKIKYHKIKRTSYANSVFTDISLDNTLNEVRMKAFAASEFDNNTTQGFENSWTRLVFSLKEDANAIYFGAFNPDTMEPKTSVVHPLSNLADDGSSALTTFDKDNSPEYLTMWLNNYPCLHHGSVNEDGSTDAEKADLAETFTGLEVALAMADDATTLKVKRASEAKYDDRSINEGAIGGQIDHRSKEFLNLTKNDKITIGTEVLTITDRSTSEASYTVTRGSNDVDGSATTAAAINLHDKIFLKATVGGELEGQISGVGQDMESIVHIDSIKFVNFAPEVENATINQNNTTRGKIRIPKTPMVFGQADGGDGTTARFLRSLRSTIPSAAYPDYTFAKLGQPTYLAFGFNQAADVEGGTNKFLMLNGFNCNQPNSNASIFRASNDGTTDTDTNNIRVGFSAEAAREKMGKQVQEAFFDSNSGAPSSALRGLEVGDITTRGDEVGLLSLDSTTVEGFTQKGFIYFNFDVDGTTGSTASSRGCTFTQRECIHASTLIKRVYNSTTVEVANPNVLRMKDDETFILYKYNETLDGTDNNMDVKIVSREGNRVTFNKAHGITTTTKNKYLISPKRFWVVFEIFNASDAVYGVQQPADSVVLNAEKTYESALLTTGVQTAGVTFAESLFSDGASANKRRIDPFTDEDDTIIDLKDYGFGEFDEEKLTGGHAGVTNLHINDDTSKYIEVDISGVVKTDSLNFGDTVPICMAGDASDENYKINVDTETGTNKPFILAVMEDELPIVTDFKIKPNDIDPYFIDFTWNCESEDAWYGFIMLDDEKSITNQYNNSIIHLPLNEEGVHGADAGTITDNVGGISVSAGGGTDARKPHYNVEGLAGYNLDFDGDDGTNADHLELGSSSDNCLSTVTDEFSVVAHIIHDDADVSSNTEYIIKKEGFELFIDQNEQVVAKLYSDADSALQLISSSKVQAGIPMNIIVTFDSLITEGNCKLFINGTLEDVSGVVVSSHGDTTDSTIKGWVLGTDLHTANGEMFIGNVSAGGSKAFDGKIEELVFYNKVLYPVNPKTGKFTLTKPLSELNATTNASSKSYSARLFVKDYHNIRGKTSQDVAASAVINFRKPAFEIDAS